MEETFKRIPPEDVFITVFKRKPTEEELWMGVPPDFDGNRPSGNNLIDLFAYLIRKYGRMDTSEYARIMQLKTSELRGAILAIGGMSAMEWRNRYLLLEAQELMERKISVFSIDYDIQSKPLANIDMITVIFHSLGLNPFVRCAISELYNHFSAEKVVRVSYVKNTRTFYLF